MIQETHDGAHVGSQSSAGRDLNAFVRGNPRKPPPRPLVQRAMRRWTEDAWGPVRFKVDALPALTLDPQQVDMLVEWGRIAPGGRKFGLSVVSGHGTGKTTVASIVGLHNLMSYEDSLTVCTAPKLQQLRDNLWAYMQQMHAQSMMLRQLIDFQATRIGLSGPSALWRHQIIARTARKGENIAGGHAKRRVIIADESSGIEDGVFEPLIAGGTGSNNPILMIGNGTRPEGFFYRSHRHHIDRLYWRRLKLSARESSLVPADHIARLEARFGKNSPIVLVRVDGDFATQSSMALLAPGFLDEARDREPFAEPDGGLPPMQIGVDVAYYGSDFTAAACRAGGNLLHIEKWQGHDTVESSRRIVNIVAQARERGYAVESINIDVIGYGAGVRDKLWHDQTEGTVPELADVWVEGVNASKTAIDEKLYHNTRTELWCTLAERYQHGTLAYAKADDDRDRIDLRGTFGHVDATTIEELESQLAPVEYRFDDRGRFYIESKDSMRAKAENQSPDICDAVALAFYQQARPQVIA